MPRYHRFHVPDRVGSRLDVFLSDQEGLGLSRSRLAELIETGHVHVDGEVRKPSFRVRPGQVVTVEVPDPRPCHLVPEEIPLPVVYEDAHLIVVNKPRGMVVHPGAGNPRGTLVNALLARCPDLGPIGEELRPGVVHRLDKDTTGLLVVAKNEDALRLLQAQLKGRTLERYYLALVAGNMVEDRGRVEEAIGRHPVHRQRMAVIPSGRPAVTDWRVLRRLTAATLLEARLYTGRTHQIRVHMAHLGYPVLGDPVYGGPRARPPGLPLPRGQALHAWRLCLHHPATGERMEFTAPPPDDFLLLLRALGGDW